MRAETTRNPKPLASKRATGNWILYYGHMTPKQVAELIRAGLPGAEIRVASDDDTHFEAVIVAAEFSGKRSLARHQLVYAALGALMGREIHALSIKAYTPEEWSAAGTGKHG